MFKALSAALALCFLLAACATPVHHNTASGKPEVFIASSDVDEIKGRIASHMMNAGYSITRDTAYQFAFDRPVDNFWVSAFFGSRYDSQPNARISYSFAVISGGTRVVADVAIITNPGSAFERRTAANQNRDTLQVQELLDAVKADVEAAARGTLAKETALCEEPEPGTAAYALSGPKPECHP